MTEETDPPITPEMRESIGVEEHRVHELFRDELKPFFGQNPIQQVTTMFSLERRRPPAPQPIKTNKIIRRYAKELFEVEHKAYPLVPSIGEWRKKLAKRIYDEILQELSMMYLHNHLSDAEIRETISQSLTDIIRSSPQFSAPVILKLEATKVEERAEQVPPLAVAEASIQALSSVALAKRKRPYPMLESASLAQELRDFLTRTAMSQDEFSHKVGASRRTIGSFLKSGRARPDIFAAIADALKQLNSVGI